MTGPADDDYSDVLTPAEPAPASTAPLPVVRRRRGRRRRPLTDRVPVRGLLVGSLLVLAVSSMYAASVFLNLGGGAAREQARPTATASQPHFAVTAPPTTRPPVAPLPQRRKPAPAIPVPATTSRRPTATPRASVSASPKPPKQSPSATPHPTPVVPSLTPGASGVTNHSSKEDPPCPT